MTEDEKKRWLWRYRDALRLERELQDELKEQQTRAARMTAAMTGMPGGNSPAYDKIPESVERILDVVNELQMQINICTDIRCEIMSFIKNIPDTRVEEIFRHRYIMGETWETIAEAMGLSSKWVKLLHDRFLQRANIF